MYIYSIWLCCNAIESVEYRIPCINHWFWLSAYQPPSLLFLSVSTTQYIVLSIENMLADWILASLYASFRFPNILHTFALIATDWILIPKSISLSKYQIHWIRFVHILCVCVSCITCVRFGHLSKRNVFPRVENRTNNVGDRKWKDNKCPIQFDNRCISVPFSRQVIERQSDLLVDDYLWRIIDI